VTKEQENTWWGQGGTLVKSPRGGSRQNTTKKKRSRLFCTGNLVLGVRGETRPRGGAEVGAGLLELVLVNFGEKKKKKKRKKKSTFVSRKGRGSATRVDYFAFPRVWGFLYRQ